MDRSAAEVDRSLERGHILALDGLRGIAILLVVTPRFILALNNSEHLLLDGNVLLARVDVK